MIDLQKVLDMVKLLTDHDVEEKRLIDEARATGKAITSTECPTHDELEYKILNAMVAMTDEEITLAIWTYDNGMFDPYFIKKGGGNYEGVPSTPSPHSVDGPRSEPLA